MRLLALPPSLLALLPALCTLVRADVHFTSPAGGDVVDVGTILVQWEEGEYAPPITSLGQYSLALITGGDEADANPPQMLSLATFVSQGNFHAGNNASGTIPAGIAEAADNGFFFRMTSAAATGGTVINYSERFSIKGLTGYTPPQYLNAIKKLDGSTAAPPSSGDAISSVGTGTLSTTTSATSSTKTSSPSPITATVTTAILSPTTAIVDPSKGTSGSNGLSEGALAGIAIACGIFGLVSLGVALWVCLKRRQRREVVDLKLDERSSDSDASLRREMSMVAPRQPPAELESTSPRVEADDGERRPELDYMTVRAELEGDTAHAVETPLTPIPATPLDCLTLDNTWTPTPTTPGYAVIPRDNV